MNNPDGRVLMTNYICIYVECEIVSLTARYQLYLKIIFLGFGFQISSGGEIIAGVTRRQF